MCFHLRRIFKESVMNVQIFVFLYVVLQLLWQCVQTDWHPTRSYRVPATVLQFRNLVKLADWIGESNGKRGLQNVLCTWFYIAENLIFWFSHSIFNHLHHWNVSTALNWPGSTKMRKQNFWSTQQMYDTISTLTSNHSRIVCDSEV